MIQRRIAPLVLAVLVFALGGCGFHLRKEVALPASMQRLHIAIADPNGQLARDLARALPRSGVQLVPAPGADVAELRIGANAFSTDVLSVSGAARANEYSLRYHVEFEVADGAGKVLLPKQTIELTREFTFDASQALGVTAETDMLTKELQRDMVQTILRRLEAAAHAAD